MYKCIRHLLGFFTYIYCVTKQSFSHEYNNSERLNKTGRYIFDMPCNNTLISESRQNMHTETQKDLSYNKKRNYLESC